MLKFVPNHERLFQGVGGFKSGQESAYFFEMYAVVLGVNLPNKGFLSPYRSDPGVLATNKVQITALQQSVKACMVNRVLEFDAHFFYLHLRRLCFCLQAQQVRRFEQGPGKYCASPCADLQMNRSAQLTQL